MLSSSSRDIHVSLTPSSLGARSIVKHRTIIQTPGKYFRLAILELGDTAATFKLSPSRHCSSTLLDVLTVVVVHTVTILLP